MGFPPDMEYRLSNEEIKIIAALRLAAKMNALRNSIGKNKCPETGFELERSLSSPELAILRKGNFKSGKESIRLFTIVDYRDSHLLAMDYEHEHAYHLWVFRFFTIIIHDTLPDVPMKTMYGKLLGQRFEGILEQLYHSGL